MAVKGQVGGQLQMFMTGEELKSSVSLSPDKAPTETLAGMWDRKASEAALPRGTWYDRPATGESFTTEQHRQFRQEIHGMQFANTEHVRADKAMAKRTQHGTGIKDSIASRGFVGDPLQVTHGGRSMQWIRDGHHRVAAAAQLQNEGTTHYIPVEHGERR